MIYKFKIDTFRDRTVEGNNGKGFYRNNLIFLLDHMC
jgi:hypothetical protein